MEIMDGLMLVGSYQVPMDKLNSIGMLKQYGEYHLTYTTGIVTKTIFSSEDRRLILDGLHRVKQKLLDAGYTNFVLLGNDILNLELINGMRYQQFSSNEHYVVINWKGMEGYRRVKSKESAKKFVDNFNRQRANYLSSISNKV